jgi:hypothetical protein
VKQILEFNLPEEQDELTLYQQGPDLACAVSDFFQDLRRITKYEDLTKYNDALASLELGIEETQDLPNAKQIDIVVQVLRRMLYNELEERKIDID